MSFDRVAAVFGPLERLAFQGAMQRARTAHLEALDGARRVLVMGEGDGRFAAALARRRIERGSPRPLRLRIVEASAAMRRRLVERLEPLRAAAALELEISPDEADLEGEADFDAVVTCFFLDCFGPHALDRLVPALVERLAPGGAWLLVDFQIPPQGLARLHARAWSWILHGFFRATTGIEARQLAHFAGRLGAAGLRLESHRHYRLEFIRSDLWRRIPDETMAEGGATS